MCPRNPIPSHIVSKFTRIRYNLTFNPRLLKHFSLFPSLYFANSIYSPIFAPLYRRMYEMAIVHTRLPLAKLLNEVRGKREGGRIPIQLLAVANLCNQLLRAGTSIGANNAEATNAISKADFKSKSFIALKEARESLYWIDLLHRNSY